MPGVLVPDNLLFAGLIHPFRRWCHRDEQESWLWIARQKTATSAGLEGKRVTGMGAEAILANPPAAAGIAAARV